MSITIGSQVHLTVDAQERQPEIGHAIGTVIDLGGGAVKVRWLRSESWHKKNDLEPMEGRDDEGVQTDV